MTDALPNIVSLPYGRCPPLHFQAPSWRHLLRLLARLSGSRLEPTVAAMAVSRTDPKLRTVIQFVKVSERHVLCLVSHTLDSHIKQPKTGEPSFGSASTSLFHPTRLAQPSTVPSTLTCCRGLIHYLPYQHYCMMPWIRRDQKLIPSQPQT